MWSFQMRNIMYEKHYMYPNGIDGQVYILYNDV